MNNSRDCRAFTMIELLLVLVLLAVIASISLPQMASMTRGVKLNAQAQRLADVIRYGQSRAIVKNHEVRLECDPVRKEYWLSEQSGAQSAFGKLSGRWGRVIRLEAAFSWNGDDCPVIIREDASLSPWQVDLCLNGLCRNVSTRDIYGKVSVSSAQKQR